MVLYHSPDSKNVQWNGQMKIVNAGIDWKGYFVSLKKIYKHNREIIGNIILTK